MLRHPSQSSTRSSVSTVISGLMIAISGTAVSASSSSSSSAGPRRGGNPATNSRTPWCTGGAAAGGEPRDEQGRALVHLRRREAEGRILLHRLEHVVDELLDARRLDVGGIDRLGARAQHGMSHPRHLQDRHTGSISYAVSVLPCVRRTAGDA